MQVDDDPLCLKVIEQMLKRCNYQGRPLAANSRRATSGVLVLTSTLRRAVTTCPNATTALELLRSKAMDFDLVLSDVYMPGGGALPCSKLDLEAVPRNRMLRQCAWCRHGRVQAAGDRGPRAGPSRHQ